MTRNERARKRAEVDAAGIILEADPPAIVDYLAAAWPPALPAGDRDPGDAALARYGFSFFP